MARRRNNPALYELIRTRADTDGARSAPLDDDRPPRRAAGDGPDLNWFSPGHTLRLPVGYVFLAVAAVLLLLVLAYALGYARGDRAMQARDDAQRFNQVSDELGRNVEDPLHNRTTPGDSPGSPGDSPGASGTANPDRSDSSADNNGRSPDSDGRQWGAIESDPRRSGLNYFLLIYTNRDKAIELAQFCRDHGLEAYVPPSNNALRRVIVLPGFQGADLGGPEARALEERIHEVGLKWEQLSRDHKNLQGAYAERYR